MDDEQQFCLKWNNHQSTLVSVFDSLLRRNQLLDCTLAAEGRSLKAHKVILSACSPYFESLLADYYDKHPVFILKDVKFKELEAMMDYMYRGEVNVSQDQLGPLLKAAESLQIKGLSDNRRESRSNNEDRKREPPILPPRDRTPPPAPSLPQVKGLVIEQKKVDIMNMNNREGSQSPGRRKKRRRQSIDADAGNDSSIENHDGASNGSSSVSVSQPIVPPNVPLNDSRSELSAASSVKTKTEENMPQVPLKQKLEPHSELMLEPKSEYIEEDMNDDSIEDLTLDDDELDMDHNRPGPSHGGQGDGSNQGFGWQMDPSQDETFMAAQEAVGQHRDAQGSFDGDDEERFNCNMCGKSYKRLGSLKYHQKYDCGNYYNDCDQCGRNYKYIRDLRHHKKYECGQGREWRCPRCLKQLMRKSWKRHVMRCVQLRIESVQEDNNMEDIKMFT
ncbi:longitudinals lacking protein, isoforms N/O/W/X/Y isoform X21 [Chrysoperla carnea]|uniref:longitudinals lacking protein, isoforms N/O/W/X/Y isoform X21 n=1 Tax=Chrysoperla carnea TaxID=189513 RepID=UPI001D06A7C0|nr:longitudinals lacking protein, isoforms N/O/W/X/Y isoform X21 [Chrysoperla carnea]